MALPSPGDLSLRGGVVEIEAVHLTLRINGYSPTKTETASQDGLDPTAEEIGVVRPYHNTPTYINVERLSRSLRAA